MAAINDSAAPAGDDLSALSWVQDELRKSLELAHKALRRYLKEMSQLSDLDTVDPAVLRQARSQLHQSVGVLELVGLGPAGEVLRAAEAALLRLSARPKLITVAAVDTIERGSFALLDFIGRRQLTWIIDRERRPICLVDDVLHRRCGSDQRKIEFTLKTLTNDLHMQKTKETAAKSETESA